MCGEGVLKTVLEGGGGLYSQMLYLSTYGSILKSNMF